MLKRFPNLSVNPFFTTRFLLKQKSKNRFLAKALEQTLLILSQIIVWTKKKNKIQNGAVEHHWVLRVTFYKQLTFFLSRYLIKSKKKERNNILYYVWYAVKQLRSLKRHNGLPHFEQQKYVKWLRESQW